MRHHRFPIHSYEEAVKYLEGARDPNNGRPLQNNTRLVPVTAYDHITHAPIECVGVLLHSTIVVAYLPNGNIVLNSGGWHSVTTQDRISNWSPARVSSDFIYQLDGTHSEYKRWIVSTSVLGHTPAKVQKCRRCKGVGSTNWEQWGRSTYDEETGEHGYERYDKPVVQVMKCWGCDGDGQRDYGSKRICPSFEDGVIVNDEGIVVAFGPPPTTRFVQRPARCNPNFRNGVPTGRLTTSGYWVAPTIAATPVYRSPHLDAYDDEFAAAPNEDGVDHGTAARWAPNLEKEIDLRAKEIEDEIHAWAKFLGKEDMTEPVADALTEELCEVEGCVYRRGHSSDFPHRIEQQDTIEFSTLALDASGRPFTVNTRTISRTAVYACPQLILVGEHYREDGTCRCDEGHYNDEGEWIPNG